MAATAERLWCDTPANIGMLIRYLAATGVTVNWTDDDYAYLCEKPWKWQAEWDEMQAQLSAMNQEEAA